MDKWVKVFKNEPSKICGRQPLKIFFDPLFNTWIHMLLNLFSLTVHGIIDIAL